MCITLQSFAWIHTFVLLIKIQQHPCPFLKMMQMNTVESSQMLACSCSVAYSNHIFKCNKLIAFALPFPVRRDAMHAKLKRMDPSVQCRDDLMTLKVKRGAASHFLVDNGGLHIRSWECWPVHRLNFSLILCRRGSSYSSFSDVLWVWLLREEVPQGCAVWCILSGLPCCPAGKIHASVGVQILIEAFVFHQWTRFDIWTALRRHYIFFRLYVRFTASIPWLNELRHFIYFSCRMVTMSYHCVYGGHQWPCLALLRYPCPQFSAFPLRW